VNLPQPQMILLVLARRHPRNIGEMYPRYAPLDIAREPLERHVWALTDAGYIEPFNSWGMYELTEKGLQAQAEVDPLIEWDEQMNNLRRLRFRE
jgi:predicted transcriptional regulator